MAQLVERLSGFSDRELTARLDDMLVAGVWHETGERVSFIVPEIAEAAGVPLGSTTAFVELFSQPFGQSSVADPMRALQAMRARPIMHDGGSYLCVDGGDLLWAARQQLEARLKADDQAWDHYERHRGYSAEQTALRFLGQTPRARDALGRGAIAAFRDAAANNVTIDAASIDDVLALTIALDEIGASPPIWEMARISALKPGEAHPTTMSLYELELVCDLLDRPSLLVHYLTRRRTLNQIGRMVASEELDLLMHYLRHGLYFERMATDPQAPSLILLESLTDPIDAHYLYRDGVRRRPANKPAARLPPEIDVLIRFMEARRPPGWTAAVRLMLDMNGEARDGLGRHIARMGGWGGS